MLQPKRVKYRKSHRGRMQGSAHSGTTVAFGEYGLRAEENAWITARQIEAARRVMVRFLRHGGKMWIRVFPDKVVTKKPAELSGGMQKRVGLARASVLKPEVMLYDEPTTGLDPIVADVINELMMRARRRYSVTSVIVTHDMRTARKVADRVVMVYPLSRLGPDEPQIIFDGPPSALDRTEDRRVRQFVRGEAGERLMEMRAAAELAARAHAADGQEG